MQMLLLLSLFSMLSVLVCILAVFASVHLDFIVQIILVCFLACTIWILIYDIVVIFPEYHYYKKLCRRFRDGEIYQDYIDHIGGLFPILKDDIKRLDMLLDRQSTMQLSTKQAEFLALQNQINPHFLYNTLDSIRGDALAAGVESIANVAEALSTFFRYTITETRNLVTIAEELENVNNYFTIQQYRFGDKLSMNIEIEDDSQLILSMQCPKLFLQPIIENSILHGLEGKTDNGVLTIHIELVDQDLHIDVVDNGSGIPEDILDELNRSLGRISVGAIVEPPQGKHSGIALKNVCRRIKLLFGEQYGIHISSIVDIGTKIEVVLPSTVISSPAAINKQSA